MMENLNKSDLIINDFSLYFNYKGLSKMFIHKETQMKFENRKQCIKLMGQNRYRRALRNQEFEFLRSFY